MRKSQVQIGKVYVAKVSGKLSKVRIIRESSYGGWDAVNTSTNRSVRIKTAGRLRYEARATSPSDANRHSFGEMNGTTVAKELSKADELLRTRPWESWSGDKATNTDTGEVFIATSSIKWQHRLDIWRTVVRRFANVANCPCPSPMPAEHIMFSGNSETYKLVAQ